VRYSKSSVKKKYWQKVFVTFLSVTFLLVNSTGADSAITFGKIWISVLQSGLGVSSPTSFHTGTNKTFTASFPLCDSDKGFPCINKLLVRKVGAKTWTDMRPWGKVAAKKNCQFCKYMTWESIPDKNLPAGGEAYNWSASGFEEVSLSASVSGYFTGDPNSFGTSDGMTYQPIGLGVEILDAFRNAPENEYEVHLKLGSLSKSLSGWFIGRLARPSLDLTSSGDLTISGESILLQNAGSEINYTDLPPDYVADLVKECIPLSYCGLESDPQTWNQHTPWQSIGYQENNEKTMKTFSQFENIFGNRAQNQYRVWAISNYSDWVKPISKIGNCAISEGFLGLVSTNATVFSSDPPIVINEALSYRVGSTHLRADGSLNSGSYGVSLRKDLAKCVWGDQFVPEFIGVEVAYKDGKAEVIATSFKSTDSFYNFNASGFHYSIPTLTMKNFKSEVQPLKVAVSEPATTDAIAKISPNSTVKKTTITCIKGKVTKTVSAVSPKCPTGYKKKP